MLLTASTLSPIFQQFKMDFAEGLMGAPPGQLDKLASKFTSNSSENVFPIVAGQTGLREWVGPRQADNIRASSYTVVNRSFEKTVEVDREQLEDAQEGDIKIQFMSLAMKQLALRASQHPEDLLVELIESTSALCYDGLTFFHDSHPVNFGQVGSSTFDNLYASTALTQANFDTVYANMQKRQGPDGKPLGIIPNVLLVPADLRSKANEIIKAENIVRVAGDGAVTNTNRNLVEIVVMPKLTSATTWYLLDTSQMVKPFIWQSRKSPEFVTLDNPTNEGVFYNKKFVFGVDYRGNAGYFLPQLASKCTA